LAEKLAEEWRGERKKEKERKNGEEMYKPYEYAGIDE